MQSITSKTALEFVRTAELPPAPKAVALEEAATFDFDKAKDQAIVVGSDIISFVKGVTEERRQDIVNSALLAQLVANEKVTNPTHVFTWYGVYFDTLTNIGWTIQEKQFVDHVESSQNFEAHKVIIDLATSLLGPQAAALQVVKSTLSALEKLDQDSPWITLFSRESQFVKTARFQVTLAEDAPDGGFLVSLMAFGLVAESKVTQVLFFKFKSNDVRLKHSSGKVTINTTVLDAIRDAVSQKIAKFSGDFVRGLPDL
jgi:hypothetical protein